MSASIHDDIQLKKYLKNKLKEEEQTYLEKRLDNEPELKERLEQLKSYYDAKELIKEHSSMRNMTQQILAVAAAEKERHLPSRFSQIVFIGFLIFTTLLIVQIATNDSSKSTVTNRTSTDKVNISNQRSFTPQKDSNTLFHVAQDTGVQNIAADTTSPQTELQDTLLSDTANLVKTETEEASKPTLRTRWSNWRKKRAQRRAEKKAKEELVAKALESQEVPKSPTKTEVQGDSIEKPLADDFYTLEDSQQSLDTVVSKEETFEDYLDEIAERSNETVEFPHFYTSRCDTINKSEGIYKVYIAKRAVEGFERKLHERNGRLIESIKVPRSDSVALVCQW